MMRSEEHPLPFGQGRAVLRRLWRELRLGWKFLRQVSGDDAYERYVEHVARLHPGETPMSRAEHFRACQEQKWSRVSRCC